MKLRLTLLPLMLMFFVGVGSCQAAHTATITINPAAFPTSGVTYQISRGTVPGGSKTVIQSGVGLNYVDNGLAASTRYCYTIVGQASGYADSDPSPEMCGSTLQDKVSTPSATIVFK